VNAMHRNHDLEERLNFSKNTDLSHDDRLTYHFNDKLDSPTILQNIKWPKSLSISERHQNIEVLPNGEAKFIGPSDANEEAGCVRSDVPIPNETEIRTIYYFEITILSGGSHSYIGIGLSTSNSNLNCLPGWNHNTYGYHGDDGRLFEKAFHGRGKSYGPKFSTNDTVGCGFNTSNRSCFFTKNGKYIGLAFKDMRKDLAFFPTVGMNSIGEKVEVNFGQKPFLYNIELEKILQEANEKDLNSKDNTKKGRKRVSEEEIDKIVIM